MFLPLPHRRQQQTADCLVACAANILEYLLIPINYKRLAQLLGTIDAGTPFSHLERLRALGFAITVAANGTLAMVQTTLEFGLPIVVAVRTWPLPHWENVDTAHAIVVVGLDAEQIYINDPSSAIGTLAISYNDFLTAWAERDYEYAIIGLTET